MGNDSDSDEIASTVDDKIPNTFISIDDRTSGSGVKVGMVGGDICNRFVS